jgi:hypothetical protein
MQVDIVRQQELAEAILASASGANLHKALLAEELARLVLASSRCG